MKNAPSPPAAAGGARRRSVAGLVIALLALPFLLGTDSCYVSKLTSPVGDPEHGWADPRLSGVWLGGGDDWLKTLGKPDPPSEFSATLWLFEPYDSKTWLVTWALFKDTGVPAAPASQAGTPPSEQGPPVSAPEPARASAPLAAPSAPDVQHILETLAHERAKPQGVAIYKGWLTTLGGRRFLVLEPKLEPSSARGFRSELWYIFRADLQGGRLQLLALDVAAEKLVEAPTRAQAEAIIARHAADPEFTLLAFTLHPVPQAAHDQARKALARAFGK